jgi:hypothetical protein
MKRFRIAILAGALVFSLTCAQAALTWTAASTLPAQVRGGNAVYYNGYVYLLGGRPTGEGAGTHAIDTVYFAPVNANGSIGAWTATTALPGKRAVGGAYAYNGKMYYWGGWMEDYTTMNTCWYATINGNGTLGSWTVSAVTIPNSGIPSSQMDSFGQGILGYQDKLYIIAGEENSGGLVPTVYYSQLTGGGDYGAWTSTTALPTNSWFHGVAIYKSPSMTQPKIYVVGGNHGGTSEAGLVWNTINNDGSVGASWTVDATVLPTAAWEIGCAVAKDSIFALAGLNGATSLAAAQRVALNTTDGSILSAVAETDMTATRARTTAVSYVAPDTNSYVLVIGGGGYAGTDPVLDTCEYAQIAASGVNDWTLY